MSGKVQYISMSVVVGSRRVHSTGRKTGWQYILAAHQPCNCNALYMRIIPFCSGMLPTSSNTISKNKCLTRSAMIMGFLHKVARCHINAINTSFEKFRSCLIFRSICHDAALSFLTWLPHWSAATLSHFLSVSISLTLTMTTVCESRSHREKFEQRFFMW